MIAVAGKYISVISLLSHSHRIWAANVMEQGYGHTKGTPDVDERSTPHRLYRNFLQALTPRLGFETYEGDGSHQDRF